MNFISLAVSILTTIISMFITNKFWRKKIYVQDKWYKISENPIPDNLDRAIFVSDGHVVYELGTDIKYNKHGQVIFGYKPKIATYWRYYPGLPE